MAYQRGFDRIAIFRFFEDRFQTPGGTIDE